MKMNRMSSALLAICCTFAAIPSMSTAQTGCATNPEAIEGEVLIITPKGEYCTASDEERADLDRAVAESYAALALQQEEHAKAVASYQRALAAQLAAKQAAEKAFEAAKEVEKAAALSRQAANGQMPPLGGSARIQAEMKEKSDAAQAHAQCMSQPGFTAAQCKGRAVAMQQQAARK